MATIQKCQFKVKSILYLATIGAVSGKATKVGGTTIEELSNAKNDSPIKSPSAVMPVSDQVRDDGSGIQKYLNLLDSRLRGNDKKQ